MDLPRHRHADGYVTLVLEGRFRQLGFVGRLECEAGDIIVQPTYDCHSDEMLSSGLRLLRLSDRWDVSFGGIYRRLDIDGIRRVAERDIAEASAMAAEFLSAAVPVSMTDCWQDHVAVRLRHPKIQIADLAEEIGVGREAMSRGFASVYGSSPVNFRNELRARAAALQILSTHRQLCNIAIDTGFTDQAHMSREVKLLTGLSPSVLRKSAEPMGEACRSDAGVLDREPVSNAAEPSRRAKESATLPVTKVQDPAPRPEHPPEGALVPYE
jgi:AraC-like DNA-binding protein